MYIENFGSGVYTVMKFIAYNGLYICEYEFKFDNGLIGRIKSWG